MHPCLSGAVPESQPGQVERVGALADNPLLEQIRREDEEVLLLLMLLDLEPPGAVGDELLNLRIQAAAICAAR